MADFKPKESFKTGFMETNPAVFECLSEINYDVPYIAREYVIYYILYYTYVRVFSELSFKSYRTTLNSLKEDSSPICNDLLEWDVADELHELSNLKYDIAELENFIITSTEAIISSMEPMDETIFHRFKQMVSYGKEFNFMCLDKESVAFFMMVSDLPKTFKVNANEPVNAKRSIRKSRPICM